MVGVSQPVETVELFGTNSTPDSGTGAPIPGATPKGPSSYHTLQAFWFTIGASALQW
jgi:hypothetical protein